MSWSSEGRSIDAGVTSAASEKPPISAALRLIWLLPFVLTAAWVAAVGYLVVHLAFRLEPTIGWRRLAFRARPRDSHTDCSASWRTRPKYTAETPAP